jgi:hypothetical protein
MPSRLFGTYLPVKVNNKESQIIADLPQGFSNVLRSFAMTATLTARPTISSEFQRTPADKKHFPGSTESACEGRLLRSEAGRVRAKKARVEGMFLQAFLCVYLSFHFYPRMTRTACSGTLYPRIGR